MDEIEVTLPMLHAARGVRYVGSWDGWHADLYRAMERARHPAAPDETALRERAYRMALATALPGDHNEGTLARARFILEFLKGAR